MPVAHYHLVYSVGKARGLESAILDRNGCVQGYVLSQPSMQELFAQILGARLSPACSLHFHQRLRWALRLCTDDMAPLETKPIFMLIPAHDFVLAPEHGQSMNGLNNNSLTDVVSLHKLNMGECC